MLLDIGGVGAEALFTGAVSITSSALPAGAASAANQATEITALGTPADVEAAGDGSIIALLKRLRTLFGTLGLDATLVAIRDRLPAALVGGRLDVNVGNTPAVTATLSAETTKVIGTVNISAGQAVTANAGTNLNTSLLAIETGGNLATVASAVATTGTVPATPTGIPAFGLISDTVEKGYTDNEVRPLSMNNSGRLRVSTYPADVDLEFFRMKNSICAFDIPDLTDGGDLWSVGLASPYP